MAPGGEMFRYPQHFGENVVRHGSHEWLPYSVVAVRAEIVKHQFADLLTETDAQNWNATGGCAYAKLSWLTHNRLLCYSSGRRCKP